MDITRWLRNHTDRAVALLLAGAGLLAVTLGWFGVSRVTLPVEQISYLASGAVLGLFLLGVGGTLWLSADLRDEWRKLDDTEAALRDVAAALREREQGVEANGRRGRAPLRA